MPPQCGHVQGGSSSSPIPSQYVQAFNSVHAMYSSAGSGLICQYPHFLGHFLHQWMPSELLDSRLGDLPNPVGVHVEQPADLAGGRLAVRGVVPCRACLGLPMRN